MSDGAERAGDDDTRDAGACGSREEIARTENVGLEDLPFAAGSRRNLRRAVKHACAPIDCRVERHGIAEVPGGTLHVAGPSPNGGWRVIEVFESAEAASRFITERLGPAFKAAGATGPPPEPQLWPVHNCMT